MINNKLYSEVEAAGFRVKTFKVEHLKEISTDFKMLAEQGILDQDFYRRDLTDFNYDYTSELAGAKSVLVIAAPQCKSLAEFNCQGNIIEAVLPPTYISRKINEQVTKILNSVFSETDYSFAKAVLPLKLLAVRSGLGRYGRNNVCYVPGLGSFVRLAAYITDYDFEGDSWGAIKSLESCSSCTACIDNCPTGAIDRDRFLIHAQNCITNFNEYGTPIPEWISPGWHDSLLGCMKCQAACPHNAKLIDKVEERICFDENETEMILNAKPFDSLMKATRDKIEYIGMGSCYNVIPRNIRLLEARG